MDDAIHVIGTYKDPEGFEDKQFVGKAMGLYGAFLLFTPSYVYQTYPLGEQSDAGLAMVVMMLAMDLTIVPYWLYGYFGKAIPSALPHDSAKLNVAYSTA